MSGWLTMYNVPIFEKCVSLTTAVCLMTKESLETTGTLGLLSDKKPLKK